MNDAQIRRQPQQERSKARVETILDVALELIVKFGAENLAIREVARRAGVPIGSLYQYFPSKTAIIRELAKRNLERVASMLQGELDRLLVEYGGRPTPAQAVNRVVDAYYTHYRDHPSATAVWAGAQADSVLRQLDASDTRHTAEFLTPSIMVVLSLADRDSAFALAMLLAEVTGSAARLSLAVPSPLREQIIAKLKIMLTATLEAHRPTAAALPGQATP
ncbi:MAG TPA: TetR/AcrR family transcriptional regulator [Steroidobacteraceae bacterium]|jgi:AcrR family transcriptional regulator|nr:TetR/AcrR family transcriptional regulator [Steroidobacteraceae bacterium]